MSWKTYLLRLAGVVIITGGGWLSYLLGFHAMVALGIMPEGDEGLGYGQILTEKVIYIFLAAVPASLISIFIKDSWRHVLYFSPLYAPILFAVFYTLFRT